jgi:hypothetical protein
MFRGSVRLSVGWPTFRFAWLLCNTASATMVKGPVTSLFSVSSPQYRYLCSIAKRHVAHPLVAAGYRTRQSDNQGKTLSIFRTLSQLTCSPPRAACFLIPSQRKSTPVPSTTRLFSEGGFIGSGNDAQSRDDESHVSLKKGTPSTNLPPPRNKKLAAVIREGIASLNQSATAIQNNAHTSKSIFSAPEGDEGADPRVLAEEHRLFTTAQECLDDICLRDPDFPLMAAEEPIMLIGVQVKASMSHADIYWALPYRILSSRQITAAQKDILRDEMEQRVLGGPGRLLIRRVNAVLSSYFPPKLRFKAAPPLLIHDVLLDLERD